jgi:serine/threonine protein kinase
MTREVVQGELPLADPYFAFTEEQGGAFEVVSVGGRLRPGLEHAAIGCVELSRVIATHAEGVIVERFAGVPLAQRLTYGPLSQQEALGLLHSVAVALEEMHRMGLMHGTLRPESLLVNDLLHVRVMDWMFEWPEPSSAQVQTLFRQGAPELLLGESAGPRSDQFALGALAHRLLLGTLPFAGATAAESLLNVLTGVWSDTTVTDVEYEAFDRVFSPDPAQRYPSCRSFVEALEREMDRRPGISTATMGTVTAMSEAAPLSLQSGYSASAWTASLVWAAGLCAALAFLFGAMSWWTQREIVSAEREGTESGDASMAAIAQNGHMRVCNTSAHNVFIRELAVGYWDAGRRLQVFENSHSAEQGWTVAPASEQNLSWNSSGAGAPTPHASWDGSVVFYFLRIEQEGKEYILSGTWDDANKGCLAVSSP